MRSPHVKEVKVGVAAQEGYKKNPWSLLSVVSVGTMFCFIFLIPIIHFFDQIFPQLNHQCGIDGDLVSISLDTFLNAKSGFSQCLGLHFLHF